MSELQKDGFQCIAPATGQEITVSGTSASVQIAGASTSVVRLCSTTACRIRIGSGAQTAVATDCYLPANSPEYFACGPGDYVAAIQESAGGKLSVVAAK